MYAYSLDSITGKENPTLMKKSLHWIRFRHDPQTTMYPGEWSNTISKPITHDQTSPQVNVHHNDLSIYLSVCLCVCLSIHGSTALVDHGRFFSFLISTQPVNSLDGGSAHRKDATCTQNTNAESHTDIHASSVIRTHDPRVWAGEDGSCLRQRSHSQW
jgi:hypothetical protein